MSPWRATLSVLLPFAAGYYLSYLLRTVNALASAEIGADLRLGAAELGLLASAYFAAFAAAQLPIGAALDRFGPRRVQLVLLPVAAAGSVLFASAGSLQLLLLGRALIGLGAAAALMAGLKALALWFPKERQALANGCYVMAGALGAATATVPAEMLLNELGWRGLFEVLGAGCAGAAALLLSAPRDPPAGRSADGAARPRLRDVYRDLRFWRVAPLSACCIGTTFALQGLWAGPWLADVAMLDRAGVARGLFAMALGLGVGAVSLGIVADRLRPRGFRPHDLLAAVAIGSVLAQLALVLRLPVPPEWLWALVGAAGGATVLSYAALAESYPKELAGRANGALNLLHVGGAFLIQNGIGLAIDRWPADAAGHYPAAAYADAFGWTMVPQWIALTWFLLCPVFVDERGDAAGQHDGRKAVLERAHIVLAGGGTLDCVVEDLSATGARVRLADPAPFPEAFALRFPGGAPRAARRRWSLGTAVGMEFEGGADRHASPERDGGLRPAGLMAVPSCGGHGDRPDGALEKASDGHDPG